MQELSPILLPVDFSERSAGAAYYSRLLAARFHAKVILLHVLAPVDLPPELGCNRAGQAAEDLERFAAEYLPGVDSPCVVMDGDPATTIVECAREHAVGLIVMPTHGIGPFRRFLLGSNTAKVLHDAQCPIWTGVHILEPPAADSDSFRSILCALDLGPQSARTLCWAVQFAHQLGAPLTVVHAIAAQPDPAGDADTEWQSRMRQAAEAELDRLLQPIDAVATVLIESGDASKVVSAAAERLSAGLLVIGRGSASGVYGRLRANAAALIRMSPCPVVSV